MVLDFDTHHFKVFGKALGNLRLTKSIDKSFGAASPRLVVLEEKFFSAHLCYKRLKNRSERYKRAINLTPVSMIMVSSSLRRLHSDEYFFFTCCNFIYKEILLLREHKLLLDMPQNLLSKLEELKEERRHQEHSKEWYWGKVPRNKMIVSSKGDSFNFERNMNLLREVYRFIISKIKS